MKQSDPHELPVSVKHQNVQLSVMRRNIAPLRLAFQSACTCSRCIISFPAQVFAAFGGMFWLDMLPGTQADDLKKAKKKDKDKKLYEEGASLQQLWWVNWWTPEVAKKQFSLIPCWGTTFLFFGVHVTEGILAYGASTGTTHPNVVKTGPLTTEMKV